MKNETLELYHGGKFPDHNSVWPLQHFGTLDAALGRIATNYHDCLPGREVANILYRCEVDLGDHVKQVSDWIVAQPAGFILLFEQINLLGWDRRSYRELMAKVSEMQRQDQFSALMQVVDNLVPTGVSAFRYPNEHEGQKGEDSYCVVDPKSVRVLSHRIVERCEVEHLPPFAAEFT
ncbi:hypothetical protein RA27_00370 [Ruegeria sp. ANG-R]|uniref:hypothetical protein n=1 Tax=Ruegeria sp. ANG-R TaxID=1577903 RepID=UPI00057F6AB1|nr:hypothetical protein [Ruegeria sp. ANG-R]KIC41907.1 hypothetical protein RA27_00370 [Ruegeria sp. ANG-R]